MATIGAALTGCRLARISSRGNKLFTPSHSSLVVPDALPCLAISPSPSRQCAFTISFFHMQSRNMITKRHNLACSMTFKAISKTGSLARILLCLHGYSSGRLAMQNLHIYNTAEMRITLIYIGGLKWLFPPRFSDQNWFTTSRPDAVLVAPISADTV